MFYYQTDKLAGKIGSRETIWHQIGIEGQKCPICELWCKEIEKKNRNSITCTSPFENISLNNRPTKDVQNNGQTSSDWLNSCVA